MIIFTLSSCFVALEDLNSKSGSPKDYWSFILFQTFDSSSIKPVSGVKWVPVLNKLALIKTCNISWNVLNKITICQSQDKDCCSERPRWDTWEQNPISDIRMCFSAPWWLCLQFRLYNIKLNLANYFWELQTWFLARCWSQIYIYHINSLADTCTLFAKILQM